MTNYDVPQTQPSNLRLQYFRDPALDFIGMEEIVIAELRGVDNHGGPDEAMREKQERALETALALTPEELAADPILEGYRSAVRQIGRSVKKFPPSAEALLGILRRTGRFPQVNPIVDIYNAHVAVNRLALGVHDMKKLSGPIRFRLSPGGEPFVPIGGGQKTTAEGDYLYADERTVLAWLDARDSDLAKIDPDNRDLIIVAQGNAAASVEYRKAALREVCEDIVRCCGGSFEIDTI